MASNLFDRLLWCLVVMAGLVAAARAAEPSAAWDIPVVALSCSGCHAPVVATGGLIPQLAGGNRDDLIAAMQAFRLGQRPATIMDRIAKGFTDQEVRMIADWYAGQR